MKKRLLIIFSFLLMASTVVSPQAISTPENIEKLSNDVVGLLVNSDFQGAISHFDETMKAAVTAETVGQVWKGLIAQSGAFRRIVKSTKEISNDLNIVIVTCEFERDNWDIRFAFGKDQKIGGLHTAAHAEFLRPSYAESSTYSESQVKVGSGPTALGGTLTMPVGKLPVPVVILIHGSGPNDRDETINNNKPFRDLAWGLATKGIAVLRFEKRTREHPEDFATGNFTVKEESVDDALLAVELMRNTPRIDQNKIFVLGHSVGGMLIPRIGKLDPKIAGLISMAGNTMPLEEIIPKQYSYLFSLDGTISTEEQAVLDDAVKQAASVKNLQQKDIGSPILYFGIPVKYWLDLHDYDPPKAALDLKQRILILQGERDYQVTMDNFERWKTSLSTKPNVTFRSYPKLNHIFTEGTGKSSPAEYKIASNIPEAVIDDIAEWIKR